MATETNPLASQEATLEQASCRLNTGPYCKARKRLPLALVQSRLFGRFLVSLPYVNLAGVQADNACAVGDVISALAEPSELAVAASPGPTPGASRWGCHHASPAASASVCRSGGSAAHTCSTLARSRSADSGLVR